MSHPIIVSLAILALSRTTFAAVDPFTTKTIHIELTDKDIVPTVALKSLAPQTAAVGFVGDLEMGIRVPGEAVFHRDLTYNNLTGDVQKFVFKITVPHGVIHYVRMRNNKGSYGVACEQTNSIGSSTAIVHVRFAPNTLSTFTVLVATH